jgi:hypothetical protein
MNTERSEGLSEEELTALRSIAQERLQEQERVRQLHALLEPTYQMELKRLKAKGVEVGGKRFCWLRFRFHRYVGSYYTGTQRYGAWCRLCGDCGHQSKKMLVGDAARSMIG